MTHKYYLSTFMKAMLMLTAFMVVVFTAFQLLLGKYISLERRKSRQAAFKREEFEQHRGKELWAGEKDR